MIRRKVIVAVTVVGALGGAALATVNKVNDAIDAFANLPRPVFWRVS
jgi:hypothetical protein